MCGRVFGSLFLLAPEWTRGPVYPALCAATVPLATLVRGSGATPTRLVVFRRPIELRAETSADLSALVLTVLVEQVSELIGRPPEEIDPRYDADS